MPKEVWTEILELVFVGEVTLDTLIVCPQAATRYGEHLELKEVYFVDVRVHERVLKLTTDLMDVFLRECSPRATKSYRDDLTAHAKKAMVFLNNVRDTVNDWEGSARWW